MIGPKQVTWGGRTRPAKKSFKSGQTAGFIRKTKASSEIAILI